LVERLPYTQNVSGSSPLAPTSFLKQKSGGLKGRRFAFFEMPQGLGKLAVSDVGNAQSES
jgi:hypothetical protein